MYNFILYRDFVLPVIGAIIANTFNDQVILENTGLVFSLALTMDAMAQIPLTSLPFWHYQSYCACH